MANGAATLPEYSRVLFRKSPLALSIVQVKFPPIEGFDDTASVRQFQTKLRTTYPQFRREPGVNFLITPTGVEQSQGSNTLRFDSLDHAWAVVISQESVSLETRSYRDIHDLSSRLTTLLETVEKVLDPKYQTRFGLRYINEIRHPEGTRYSTWRKLLNSDLFPTGFLETVGGHVDQTIAELRTSQPNGSLLLRHGFLDGTTVVPQQNQPPKNGPFYLLDMDYSDQTATDFDPDPSQRLAEYNDILYRLFRWAIGDGELYQFLRGEA